MSLQRLLLVTLSGLGCACVALTLLPAQTWRHPTVDVTYSGVDPGLVVGQYGARADKGDQAVSSSAIHLGAERSRSVINLVTSPMDKFNVDFDITVYPDQRGQNSSTVVALWSPLTAAGYMLSFSEPAQSVETRVVLHGSVGQILQSGQTIRRHEIGSFRSGEVYRVKVEVDKRDRARFSIAGPGLHIEDTLSRDDLEDLFRSVRLSITAGTTYLSGSSDVVLANYHLILPHQVFWANKVDDQHERLLLIVLSAVGMCVVGASTIWQILRATRPRVPDPHPRSLRSVISKRSVLIVGGGIAAYLVVNVLLFQVGNHPFDMGNEEVYAYVGGAYGPWHLYYLPNTVSLAWIWGGIPYAETGFPYEPVFAYLFSGIGSFSHLVFGDVAALSKQLEYAIKFVNVVFALADGWLIYLITRKLTVNKFWSLLAAGLFVFNPAVWFSMSVWGQTHVISLTFVLIAIWAAEMAWPLVAWLSLAAACLTRPQMLVFGLVLGVFLLRRFTAQKNLVAISLTVIVVFATLAPLTLATSPSLPVDVMANNFRIQEAGGNDPMLTTVSQDAYSVWPLVTYFRQGASGFYRSFTPSAQSLLGSVTYQRAGLAATAIVLLVVLFVLLRRKREDLLGGAYLPLVALGIVGFLMFMTGLVATHFLLALPFIILCRRWISSGAFFFIVIVWTITTLVPMYGDMGNVIARLDYPLLSPLHNRVTRFFVELYSWDRFITFATLANTAVLIWIAVVALRPRSQPDLIEATT